MLKQINSIQDLFAGVFQLAEKWDLKSQQCGFDSHHLYCKALRLTNINFIKLGMWVVVIPH